MQLLPCFTQNSSIFSNKSSQCGLLSNRCSFTSLEKNRTTGTIQKKDGLDTSAARVNMCGFMIVREDHNIEAAKSQDGRHTASLPGRRHQHQLHEHIRALIYRRRNPLNRKMPETQR